MIENKDLNMIGNSSYDRIENDAYYTRDISMLDGLYHFYGNYIGKNVWEPACGSGHISNYFKNRGHEVLSTDLNCKYEDGTTNVDFLKNNGLGIAHGVYSIVTNPPFEKKICEGFVRKSLELFEVCPKNQYMSAHFLLRNEWDCASTRKDIFNSEFYKGKIVLCQRPLWVPKKKGDSGPRHNYAWYNFNNFSPRQKTINYYYKSEDLMNYTKIGRSYKRIKKEKGLDDYIYV